MRYNFSSHSECIYSSIDMNTYTHTHTYVCVCVHVQVYLCVYIVIFQIYLRATVIEFVVLIDKSEFSPRSFLSFSKATNKKKLFLPQSRKGQ